MILIETVKCEGKLEALKLEREYIDQYNATLNGNLPYRTEDERKQMIKLGNCKRKDYKHDWYIKNADRIKEWKNGLVNCSCGFTYTTANKAKHERSQKHQNYLKSISEN